MVDHRRGDNPPCGQHRTSLSWGGSMNLHTCGMLHSLTMHACGSLFMVGAQTIRLHLILRLDAILAQVYMCVCEARARADVQTSTNSGRSSDRRDDPTAAAGCLRKDLGRPATSWTRRTNLNGTATHCVLEDIQRVDTYHLTAIL